MSAKRAAPPKAAREVRWLHLGLPEARYYLACSGHLHAFRRVGYRSAAFTEDAAVARIVRGAA